MISASGKNRRLSKKYPMNCALCAPHWAAFTREPMVLIRAEACFESFRSAQDT